jgi:hypothetical protein
MTVSSYLFQSPYTQPFQVGRPDPAMVAAKAKEEEQNRSDSNTQALAGTGDAGLPSAFPAKSATAYANSEGFGMSVVQVQQLSEASFKSNQGSFVKIYSENS